MNIETNDPRLTAYALGELDDAERVQFEALLSDRADLRAEVEAIKGLASELHDELMHEPTPVLSGDQRESIKAQAASGLRLAGAGDETLRPAAWWWRIGISGAAAVLLLGVALPLLNRSRGGGADLAIDDSRDNPPAEPSSRAVPERGREELSKAKESEFFGSPAGSEAQPTGGLPGDTGVEARQFADQLYMLDAASEGKALGGQDFSGGSVMSIAPTDSPASTATPELRMRRAQTRPSAPPAGEREVAMLRGLARRTQEEASRLSTNTLSLGQVPDELRDGETIEGDADAYGRRDAMELQSRDRFTPIVDNAFFGVTDAPLSTFSIDVDTASYSIIRRQLKSENRPSPDSVRLEEMINYFDYDYDAPSPGDPHPFRANVEIAACPWTPDHRLVRIGIKGMEIPHDDRPATNLVFLLDVSGSMTDQNKLPLVKEGFKQLVDNLTVDDRVAIVVYAGASGVVLDSTYVSDKETILASLDNLRAGGSTNGGAGIELAYKIAQDHFIEGGVNRVILATDGDFNVGVTGDGGLIRLIEEKAKTGVFLTTLGYGMGNLNDAMLEQLADKGNGMCAYIDTIEESQKVLIDQMSGSLVTIAKDVKIQVEFNPALVKSYRLLGYENRVMAAQDFNDDTKDAGEIGAGHTVTALYEIEPAYDFALANAEPKRAGFEAKSPGAGSDAERDAAPGEEAAEVDGEPVKTDEAPAVDPLRYQAPAVLTEIAQTSGELLTVKLRYKQPDGDTSTLVEFPAVDAGHTWEEASDDFRFASSVAAFGMILRDSPYRGSSTYGSVMDWARSGEGDDSHGYRQAFVDMVSRAKSILAPHSD